MRRVPVTMGLMLAILGGLLSAAAAAEAQKPVKAKLEPASAAKEKPGKEDDIYELQRLLVDTLDQVERNYVRPVDRRKLVEAAIKGMLAELDPYSSYIGPEEMDRFRTVVESEFGGIGIRVAVDQRGQLRVISPVAGTPAYRAGITAGDRIVEIDGKSTEHLGIDEAVRRLKGETGTQVTLGVIHPGKDAKEVIKITRESIHVETVLGDHRNPDDTWSFMLDRERRIAYVCVTAFSRDTAGELRRALAGLQKENIRGLILDLRFNPGGLLDSAVAVARLFVSKGRIVSTSGRNTPERVWEARKEGAFEGFRMAVLVNRYSASASEIVAACLQDHKRAVIVGERTWGKGSVQNVIELEYSAKPAEAGAKPGRLVARSALKLTTAGYRRPNGKNIDKPADAKEADEWGVSPDKNYELALERQEMEGLMADRWEREIVTPKPSPSKPAETRPAPAPSKPEAKRAEPGPPSPAPKSGGKPPQAPSPPGAKPSHFVDRQLQLALGYLTGELARAN